jgi:hypothetical protein
VYAILYKFTDEPIYLTNAIAFVEGTYDICPYCLDDQYAFSLANFYALINNKEKCFEYLQQCEKLGKLPPKNIIQEDIEFDSIKDEPRLELLHWPVGNS